MPNKTYVQLKTFGSSVVVVLGVVVVVVEVVVVVDVLVVVVGRETGGIPVLL